MLFIIYCVCGCCCICVRFSNFVLPNLFMIIMVLISKAMSPIRFIIITSISLFVHIYSLQYMNEDPHKHRFISYLSLFTFFMIILVCRNNFILLLIGWEGVGICSYLLINFWYTRTQANKSGIKAIIINRIGDIALLIRTIIIIKRFGRTKFENLTHIQQQPHTQYIINSICLLLLIAAIGKSSLIGLHIWLPDAMEGPTPISALIHAATMVTAGIFFLFTRRLNLTTWRNEGPFQLLNQAATDGNY